MKKLLLGIVIVLSVAGCDNKKNHSTQAVDSTVDHKSEALALQPSTSTSQKITLNGIPFADAGKMVTDFMKAPGFYNSKTSIWFSKAYVDSVAALLKAEAADGVRIYFARKADGTNTIVIVSTKAFGANATAQSRANHQDYFEHSEPFLNTPIAKNSESYDDANGGASLYMKNFTCSTATDGCNASALHYVSCAKAQLMVNTFSATDTIKANAEWFDTAMVFHLKRELQKGGGDGIRIYYAKRVNPGVKQYHGFVFVTTTLINKVHTDYFQCHDIDMHVANAQLESSAKARERSAKGKTKTPIVTINSDDNGEQCPDSCTGATWTSPAS